MTGRQQTVGERLQELRHAKGLSQSQLARAAGLPAGSVKNWEQGTREPSLANAWLLARALGVTLDEFVGPNPRFKGKAQRKPKRGGRKGKGTGD